MITPISSDPSCITLQSQNTTMSTNINLENLTINNFITNSASNLQDNY